MPDSTRCRWRDIGPLLPAEARGRYEKLGCADRAAVEARYWNLSTPRLGVLANEWRAEFLSRRVITTLFASGVSPHRQAWGRDAAELTLRYGWPLAWSRIIPATALNVEPEILGHDPSPSFHYGPSEALLAGGTTTGGEGWAPTDVRAPSRYAHPAVRRIAPLSAQLATFRRGDSTLLVGAWATSDDSLPAPAVALGAVLADGRIVAAAGDSLPAGRAQLMVPGPPVLAGVEAADSARGVIGWWRAVYGPVHDTTAVVVSDLLLYRARDAEPPDLAGALARALTGDTISRSQPVGLYWEAYGADTAGAAVETTVLVERIDRGIFQVARQRLGLADAESPLTIRWNESRRTSDRMTTHALSLDLSPLPAGRYRLTVAMTPATGAGAVARREIELQ